MLKMIPLLDFQPDMSGWGEEVLAGLQESVKRLPSKLFYDERGSQLFDEITQLPEYYPTRVEQVIMDEAIDEIAHLLGEGCLLIEYGSGSSQKTGTLLSHLPNLAGYVPIDISKAHLMESARHIATAYPTLEVLPVCADYEQDFYIPQPTTPPARRIVYYPGSTIGNFHFADAVQFLRQMRAVCGADCELLIGVDLKKDEGILHRAYNDCDGVTAAFNINMLRHINHVLGSNFQLEQFAHEAFYNSEAGRIEMHLISLVEQVVDVQGQAIHFDAGECIWTESSYKYRLAEFADLAAQAGFTVQRVWTGENRLFSVQYLIPNGEQA